MTSPEVGLEIAIKEYGRIVNAGVLRILGEQDAQDIQECISNVFIRL